MRLLTGAFLALAIVAISAARAGELINGSAQVLSGTEMSYAKYKGWKGKAVKRRGPPP
jgi:hypothetical protein